MNKTELNRLLVEERKKERAKQKNSEFMRRSLSIYNGQKKRAVEDFKITVPYLLEEFREWLKPFMDKQCGCGKKLTIKQISIDHMTPVARGGSWELSNLEVLCKSCNFRKGILLKTEFVAFEKWVNENLSPESAADVWRRLVSGGKMTFGK
jgi:5-methylcytosine-specific restriction protein A